MNVSLRSTCTQLTVQFSGFAPDANNVVDYQITVDQTTPAKHALTMAKAEFSFTGSSATQQIPVIGFPGHGHIDDRAHWNTNGHRGGFDISEKVECPPTPAFTVEKRQRIGGGSYTQGELVGEVGQTVEYEIIVKNTGNVPLTITPSNVIDPHCDAGTITGGPASGLLEVAASATYTCTHLLNAADHEAHSYTNTASVTAQPPDGDGDPIEHATNTVVVTVNETKKPENGSSGGNNGNNGSTTSFTPAGSGGKTPLQFQVLAFQQTTPPSLLGPQGCVRSKFRASLRSKGVAIVAFYLDGHLLRKVTARVARRGVISITINISKLRVGAHKLVAKIVMARAASSSKPVHASRSLTFVRCASAAVRPKFTG